MAYNTTTERLLNAIKSNTANITLTIPDGAFDNVQISAINETTQTAIQTAAENLISNGSVAGKINLSDLKTLLETLVSTSSGAGTNINLKDVIDSLNTTLTTYLNTNSSLVTAVSNLTADNADNTGNDVTLEDLRLLLKTIDTDTSNLKTNSDKSLALNTAPSVVNNATIVNASTGTNVAVTFLEAAEIASLGFGGATPTVFSPTTVPVAAGVTIYGDITALTLGAAKTCIVYKS